LGIIELGANDGLRGVPLSEIEKNFTRMLELIRASRALTVVLRMQLPPNYGPDYTHGFAGIYDRLPSFGDDVRVAPFFLADIALNPRLLQSDGLHPTAEAQPQMLDVVWATVAARIKK
jgi:acyl-CoA thioesterase I